MLRMKRLSPVLWIAVFLVFTCPAYARAIFTDVPENHPHRAAIDYCLAKGIIQGTGANTFLPDAGVTRAQLAAIWCRALHIKGENPSYTDISPLRNYYDSPAIILRSLGIMKGTSDESFSPNDRVTRAQLASLAMRAHRLGVADKETYKAYNDYGTIPTWARDGVSACINAKVLEDLYDGRSFEPNKYVTRAEVCKLMYNIQLPDYSITIAPLTGGTITANRSTARPGTIITLTVIPDVGQQLKKGSLKYDNTALLGTTFSMPAKDIIISAEFEYKAVTVESLTILNPPVKRIYTVGETLDLMGLVVNANYSNGVSNPVQAYTTEPPYGSVLGTPGTVAVKIYYKEGNVTTTATFTVLVNTK